jgi:hypothetical protein
MLRGWRRTSWQPPPGRGEGGGAPAEPSQSALYDRYPCTKQVAISGATEAKIAGEIFGRGALHAERRVRFGGVRRGTVNACNRFLEHLEHLECGFRCSLFPHGTLRSRSHGHRHPHNGPVVVRHSQAVRQGLLRTVHRLDAPLRISQRLVHCSRL